MVGWSVFFTCLSLNPSLSPSLPPSLLQVMAMQGVFDSSTLVAKTSWCDESFPPSFGHHSYF